MGAERAPSAPPPVVLRGTIVGLAATMLGIGVARFSLLALGARWIEEGTLSRPELAAVNGAGLLAYAIGAYVAPSAASRFGTRTTGRWAGSLLVAAVAAEALGRMPLLVTTRAALGALGAILMTLGPAVALRGVSEARRGWVASWVFVGVGAGAFASSVVVRALSAWGSSAASTGLATLALIVAVVAWLAWPPDASPAIDVSDVARELPGGARGVRLLQIAYGALAVGYVPCTVFLGSHTAIDLRLGAAEAARVGMAFGAGGVVGALLAGATRRLFGASRAVPLLLAVYAATTFAVLVARTPRLVEVLAVAAGALTPALVAATAARLADLDTASFQHRWGTTTALFALMQAVAGAGFATLSAASESDFSLFAIGGCFLLVGAVAAAVPAGVVTTPRPTAESRARTSRPRPSAE